MPWSRMLFLCDNFAILVELLPPVGPIYSNLFKLVYDLGDRLQISQLPLNLSWGSGAPCCWRGLDVSLGISASSGVIPHH